MRCCPKKLTKYKQKNETHTGHTDWRNILHFIVWLRYARTFGSRHCPKKLTKKKSTQCDNSPLGDSSSSTSSIVVDFLRLVEVDLKVEAVGRRVPVGVLILLEVEPCVPSAAEIRVSRARWWDFSSGLLVLAASVTLADAFGTRLSCEGTQADSDIEEEGQKWIFSDIPVCRYYLISLNFKIYNCTVARN